MTPIYPTSFHFLPSAMHIIYAPEEAMNRDGKAFDEVSDAVDEGQSKISATVLTINLAFYLILK